MILVDTSIWIDHLHGADRAADLLRLLEREQVLTHPWVLGELALGHLGPRRDEILADLRLLPSVERAADDEILAMIDARGLAGSGLGWVDAGLLATALAAEVQVWTCDAPLKRISEDCGVHFRPQHG